MDPDYMDPDLLMGEQEKTPEDDSAQKSKCEKRQTGLQHKHIAEELLAASGHDINNEEDQWDKAWA